MRVLWVENHSRFVSVARHQFLAPHALTVVPSLDAAREAVAHEAFDAFLVDFDLDDGKGDAFVRELRQRLPKVVIIATSSHEEGNTALLAAGANAACSKLQFGRISSLLDSFVEYQQDR